MAKIKMTGKVIQQDNIAGDIFSLVICADTIAKEAIPGQFVNLYSKDGSRLLPRPISLCEIDRDKGLIRLVYRIAGAGTEEFSRLTSGDNIDIMGPLGNGFTPNKGKAIIIGAEL